jgi:UTP--glucose-1-phosphate uridylyltransferase
MGTRFLPATKAVPKELLPIIDTPALQLIIDEAVGAGIDHIEVVTSHAKPSIEAYFAEAPEVVAKLRSTGRGHVADHLEAIGRDVRISFAYQDVALGLGHAVWCGREAVGDEPFAVLLPDDLIWNRGPGALAQMADVAERSGASVIAVQDVPHESTGSYDIVATEAFDGSEGKITAIVEKPKPADAPSDLAVVGRYVLSSKIFDLLEKTVPGAGGEIQLTDAIAALIESDPVHAYRFEGTRFDCGTHIGLIEATIRYALDHEKLSKPAQDMMRRALADVDAGSK